MDRATRLHALLEEAGVPLDGCDCTGKLHFRSDATEAQKEKARQIVAVFDFKDLPFAQPNQFLDRVAQSGNLEAFQAAQMLARFAYQPFELKRAFAALRLQPVTKTIIEDAANRSHLLLTSK